MKSLKLKDLDLSLEESRDIIEFLAQKRGANYYKHKSNDELLSALKESEKHEKSKNNQPQKIKSKNKERIDVIREELKDYYKPTFVKGGYNNNYTQCESKGDLGLIEPYLADMINNYKSKG